MDPKGKVNILLVDDRPDKLVALEAILADPGHNLVKARSGKEALRALLDQDFAVILLDVNMPGMDGFETASLIRQRQRSEHTPIIFFTAVSDTDTHVSRGYSLGAVDYIHTPVVPEVLRAKVNVFVELFRKTEQVKQHAEKLRQIAAREHQRELDDAMERLASEAKRNLFFVLSIDMLCIAGFDGFFKQLNPAWEKVLGFKDEELKAFPLIEFIHPYDQKATAERVRELESGTSISYFENRFRSKDGSYRWLGWTASAYAAEKLLYMFARDITDRKQAEEASIRLLVDEQQRAAQLQKLTAAALAINSAPSSDSMLQIVADQAREIIGANQALVKMSVDGNWARASSAVSLSGMSEPKEPFDADPSAVLLYAQAIAMNRPLRMTEAELEDSSAFGRLLRDVSPPLRLRGWLSVPLTRRDGCNMGLIQLSDKNAGEFTDEDEVLLVQLAQIASIAIENTLFQEARESNRLKDEFLAILSHELRTPLTAMLGWTRLLRSGKLDEAKANHALEIIERNVRVQAHLIDELLDLSRIITGKLSLDVGPVEFAQVVQSAIDTLRPAAEAKEVRLESGLDSVVDGVSGDPDRLQQVVYNLLSNAIKFTPKGGLIQVRLKRSNIHVEMTVTDTGEGISPELLPYIFDRFRQGDSSSTRSHGGLGLGLAIVRHLVELHGGAVYAESRGKGHGATFVVRLPVVEAGAEHLEEKPLQVTGPRPSSIERFPSLDGIRVLVVEDEADARDLVATELKGRGAEVTAVASAQDALEMLEHFLPDVLVSDISMPGEDGYSLIRKVRARTPELVGSVPAIALTAYARGEDRSLALSAGFQMHLPKPIELGELFTAIASLAVDGRRSQAFQKNPSG